MATALPKRFVLCRGPDAQTIPIIAITAETFAEDIQKCRDVGMNDHVAKPLVPDVLFATLAKYIAPNQ
jgi:CheY-like chemotaxis protein